MPKTQVPETQDVHDVYLSEAIDRVNKGDSTCLYIAYSGVTSKDRSLVRSSGRAVSGLLKQYTMQQMLSLNEYFRGYPLPEWRIDWRNIRIKNLKDQFETEEDYVFVLILGSFHPNGYYREQCLRELIQYPETLPFIVLRMNDWVLSIRLCAAELAKARVKECSPVEIIKAAPALNKVRQSSRRDFNDLLETEQAMSDLLEQKSAEVPLETGLTYEYAVRRDTYRFLFFRKILSLEDADYLLVNEKHSFCQVIIIDGMLKHYMLSGNQIDRYLCCKSSAIRRKVLNYKYELLKDAWPGLEGMLLDHNHGIRQSVSYILQHHGSFDITQFYISHLQDSNPVVPILGLGESGSRDMEKHLWKYLEQPNERVICATLASLSKLIGTDGYDLYWTYLFHPSYSVSKAGYQCIRNNHIQYGAERIYQEYLICQMPHIKRFLLLLLLQEKSWDRLVYLIKLYQDDSLTEMHDRIMKRINQRSVYGIITQTQAEQIKTTLDKCKNKLPEKLVKQILFDLRFVTR